MTRIAAIALTLGVASQAAAALVIDFEVFRVEDNQTHDHSGVLEFQGFRITSVPPPTNAFRYVSPGTLHPLFAGSTSVWNGQSNAQNILTAVNGGEFSLLSIDLAALAPGASDPNGLIDPGTFDLTFTGTLAGGGTVTNTFSVNEHFLAFDTFTFAGFDNVVSVSWFQGAGFSPPGPPLPGQATHQFDNIRVAPVPEPSAVLIWLGGITAAALGIRPRRRSTHHHLAL